MTNAGITVAVAAGNGPADASTISPARAPNAIAVAASDITDSYALFSNYGSPVAVFAPGIFSLLSHSWFQRSSDFINRPGCHFCMERWKYKHPRRDFYGISFSFKLPNNKLKCLYFIGHSSCLWPNRLYACSR
jgi:Subtilase family